MAKFTWGLVTIERNKMQNNTAEEWNKQIREAKPQFFKTAKECFNKLGFKLPYCRNGYSGMDNTNIYILTKYVNGEIF